MSARMDISPLHGDIHWLSVSALFEDLWRHVARRPTGCSQDVELLFVHYPGQAEICYQQICVVLGRTEEQILRLQVPVNDAMVVKICHCRQRGSDQVCCVALEVTAFSAYAIEELSAERKVCHEIY